MDSIEEFNAVFVPPTGRYKFGSPDNRICLFNGTVDCEDKSECGKCGWNPAVQELRTQEIRRRLKREQSKD